MTSPERERVELSAVVDRVVFAKEESGFGVVKVLLENEAFATSAVGPLATVQPGETVRLFGWWEQDPSYGRQLRVERYEPILPVTTGGIERYLGSGLVPGIAKGLAKRLVDRFGADTLKVIEEAPDRLKEVSGLGKGRREKLIAAFGEQRASRDALVFFHSHGLSSNLALKVLRVFGKNAVALVRADPFRLAQDIDGVGFRTADRIATALGLAQDAPRRIEAAIIHALGEAAAGGQVFLDEGELERSVGQLIGCSPAATRDAVDRLTALGRTICQVRPESPATRTVYARMLYQAEVGAAEHVARILAAPLAHAPRGQRLVIARALPEYEAQAGIALAEEQRAAVQKAVESKVLVVSGGPGTGKTTILRAIIALLELEGRRILLAAPTGRAARRAEQATGRTAMTLHRLLDFNPRTMSFGRDEGTPLEADVVIVDETSMVDLRLFHQLVRALPSPAQLLLVGDADQLPSVGPGRVLADLLESKAVPTARLHQIFRQAEASAIVKNAHRINRGEPPEAPAGEGTTDFYFIFRQTPEDIRKTLLSVVLERIPQRFSLDPRREVQVLTPMHRGLLGATELNAELQRALCPGPLGIARGPETFRVGDKVIQLRNNYDLEVYNGDIGFIEHADPEDRAVVVGFEGRRVSYPAELLDELSLAYAITIHKSQGSEFPAVVIPLSTQHAIMLRRNLLYTAITRGRKLVVVVGDRRALGLALSERRVERRNSALAQRLSHACGPRNVPI